MKTFGIAGFSGSGKTVLIAQLLPLFAARGLKVSVLKRTHHDVDLDKPGKDSYRHRAAGAREVMVVSPDRWALLHETRAAPEPELDELLARLSPCDIVLVEGFKNSPHPKLEVFRAENGSPPLYAASPHVVAVATDQPAALLANPAAIPAVPVLDLNDAPAVARFILGHLGMERKP